MTAIFNFQSLLMVLLLLICTCTYVHGYSAKYMDAHQHGYVLFETAVVVVFLFRFSLFFSLSPSRNILSTSVTFCPIAAES